MIWTVAPQKEIVINQNFRLYLNLVLPEHCEMCNDLVVLAKAETVLQA
jgi:hypothetical protein